MWRITAAGDAALLVTLGQSIDPVVLGQVIALETDLRRRAPRGLLSTVPAYASLLCRFSPAEMDASTLEALVRDLEKTVQPQAPSGDVVEVPVHYDGPDLDRVADHSGLTRAAVAEVHASSEYLVYAIGFAPGFTYCGELPEAIAMPRLASPRPRVPAGSIGIAGRQTGIYAVESPGGWNLVGRTDLRLFDAASDPPVRLKVGDRLRFRPLP